MAAPAMAEVIENAVREANTQIVTEHGFKLAARAAGDAADRRRTRSSR